MSAALTKTTVPGRAAEKAIGGRRPGLFVHRVGRGEPLVLLHGLGESHIGWRPVLAQLAASYDVLAVDLPGFGRSPVLPAGRRPSGKNLTAAITATLDDLGVDRYHVAGYSLGARLALHLAATDDRVRSVVAIGPDGMGTPVERLQGYYTLAAARGIAAALAPAADWLSRTPTGRTLFFAGNRSRPWQLTPGDAHQLLTGFTRADAFHDTNRAGSIEIPTYLHRIRQPILLLQGTADPTTPQVLRYLPFLPHARLRWIPGGNHVVISDAPDAAARSMLEFLHTIDTEHPERTGTR